MDACFALTMRQAVGIRSKRRIRCDQANLRLRVRRVRFRHSLMAPLRRAPLEESSTSFAPALRAQKPREPCPLAAQSAQRGPTRRGQGARQPCDDGEWLWKCPAWE